MWRRSGRSSGGWASPPTRRGRPGRGDDRRLAGGRAGTGHRRHPGPEGPGLVPRDGGDVSRRGSCSGSTPATGGSRPRAGWTSRRSRRRTWPSSSTTCRWAGSSIPTSRGTGCSRGRTWPPPSALAARLKTPVIASGGVGTLEDLARLAALPDRGLHRRACLVRRSFPAQRGAETGRRPFFGTLGGPSSARSHPGCLGPSARGGNLSPNPGGTSRHGHDLSHHRYPEHCPGWTWGVGQDEPGRRPALHRRRHRPARLGRRRDQHLRRRRRGETTALHHRLPPAPPRVGRASRST